MIYSLLTPTYNRAHTLPKVYESLKAQTLLDFEWIIVDDGSTDNTGFLVNGWIKEAPFVIRYFKQSNAGHHVATNKAILEAQGEFCLPLDSDDRLLPEALEMFWLYWKSIPVAQRKDYVGVTALIQTQSGQILGQKFRQHIFDSDTTTLSYILRFGGDRKGMLRTDILKENPYPVFEAERFISDSIIWHRIARTYKTRFINEVLCVSDYLSDGQTLNTIKHLLDNPKGSSLYYQELLNDPHRFSFKVRLGIHAYFVRYSLHAGYDWGLIGRVGSKNMFHFGLGSVLGYLLYVKDRVVLGRMNRPSKSKYLDGLKSY